MRLGDALKTAVQLADSLSKAHAAGIIHARSQAVEYHDQRVRRVKVLDFGLAKLTDETPFGEDDATPTKRLETEEGSIMGTAAYMSPEQAEGHQVSTCAAIFLALNSVLSKWSRAIARSKG